MFYSTWYKNRKLIIIDSKNIGLNMEKPGIFEMTGFHFMLIKDFKSESGFLESEFHFLQFFRLTEWYW